MKRVIGSIDGYNLYYGLRDRGWRRFYWLNLQALVRHMLKPEQVLREIKYFTTIVEEPPDKRLRQAVFLEVLHTLPDFHVYYGHFLSNPVTCQQCGHTYEAHHEKMTDVNIAVELLTDAFQDRFDVAFLVSGDSDLTPAVRAVRRLFSAKRVVVAFPPRRFSSALRQTASAHTFIGRDALAQSAFPDEIVKPGGYILRRPVEWQ